MYNDVHNMLLPTLKKDTYITLNQTKFPKLIYKNGNCIWFDTLSAGTGMEY